jgi:hypothetical protein
VSALASAAQLGDSVSALLADGQLTPRSDGHSPPTPARFDSLFVSLLAANVSGPAPAALVRSALLVWEADGGVAGAERGDSGAVAAIWARDSLSGGCLGKFEAVFTPSGSGAE